MREVGRVVSDSSVPQSSAEGTGDDKVSLGTARFQVILPAVPPPFSDPPPPRPFGVYKSLGLSTTPLKVLLLLSSGSKKKKRPLYLDT